jgi:hypothetical protein
MTATLKRDLGEAAAFLGDKSGGYDNSRLRDVLVELISSAPLSLDAFQATIATASIGGKVMDRAAKLKGLRTSVETCGTADSTTVQVHVNGSAVTGAEATTAHDDADGTKQNVALSSDVALAAGDLVELVVSAAPTAGSNLAASAIIEPDITVET